MAKRLFFTGNISFTNQAYATALTGSTYMAIIGGTSTQIIDTLELFFTGQSTATNVTAMQLCRSIGTVAATPTALASPNSDGPMGAATALVAGSVPASFVAAGTNPQASNAITDAKLNIGVNSYGGAARWNASPFQQWQQVGNATGLGVSVLFNSTASGAASAALGDVHWMYEPY